MGLYRNIKKWYGQVKKSGEVSGVFVAQINSTIWTNDERREIKDFIQVSFPWCGVRITMPELCNGFTNMVYTQHQRVVLLYTEVYNDLECLNFIETETLSTFLRYYSDILSIKLSGSSDFVNNNSVPELAFPTAVGFSSVSAIGETIRYARSYNHPPTLIERNVVLAKNQGSAQALITTTKGKILALVFELWFFVFNQVWQYYSVVLLLG